MSTTGRDEVTAECADWQDEALAREWAGGDRLQPFLSLPRRMTAEILAVADPPVRRVLDVGSGPGGFLEAVLDRCPQAAGVWTDVSPAMRELAAERLGRFGDRVEYRILDAEQLAAAGPAGSLDAVITSRVTHHLAAGQLAGFYGAAARLAGRGGWIANLDHVRMDGPWAARLARARATLVPPNPSPHRHDRPRPTLEDHLGSLTAASAADVAVAWRAFSTVLLLARRTL